MAFARDETAGVDPETRTMIGVWLEQESWLGNQQRRHKGADPHRVSALCLVRAGWYVLAGRLGSAALPKHQSECLMDEAIEVGRLVRETEDGAMGKSDRNTGGHPRVGEAPPAPPSW